MSGMNLQEKEFQGIIYDGIEDYEGRYKVHVAALYPTSEPILLSLSNEVLGNRFSRWYDPNLQSIKSSGSYYPLQSGMKVIVKFKNNDINSGYIHGVVSEVPLIDSVKNRDTFYLLNKTVNGSYIYQDDSRNITHLMHSNGKSNVFLDDDRVVLSTNEPVNTGKDYSVPLSYVELTKNTFKVSSSLYDNYISMDESGIVLRAGNSMISISSKGIQFDTPGDIKMNQGNFHLKAGKLFLEGSDELHLMGNVVRMAGNTSVNINGGIVSLDSFKTTYIKSNLAVIVESLSRVKVSGTICELSALTNLSVSGLTTTIDSQMLNLSGSVTNIAAGSIFMDGILNHNLGVASSSASGMVATNLGLNLGVDAAVAATSISSGMNDMVSGIVNATLVQTLPGSARFASIGVPPIINSNSATGISEAISYIKNSDESYNKIVQDQYHNFR
jgi:hypothetical protein